MQTSPFYLSNHAFFCLADGHYVFLDLRHDEYMCLGREETQEFRKMLDGSRPLGDDSVIVRTLLDKDLFVRNEADGKQPVPQTVESASASLMIGSADRPRPAINPVYVLRFFAAAGKASWNLRFQPIEATVRNVERRKLANRKLAPDRRRVIELFSVFQTLRPYYPRPYLCLFDSLALIHFMAQFRVYPEWVYGVKLEPWGAHCWVQSDDLVVNDIVDNVNGYTPIMSI